MASLNSQTSDQGPEVNRVFEQSVKRWTSLAWGGITVPVLLLQKHSVWVILAGGALYGLALVILGRLLTHPLRPVLTGYARAFAARSPRLMWTLAVIFCVCFASLFIITGSFFLHTGADFDSYKRVMVIPMCIATLLSVVSGAEWMSFEAYRSKPKSSNQT